jgi:sulfatase maturation enzyme AslB (radical SAM superfamily)
VNKEQLLKKLETAIDEAARQRMYGNIEIEFRGGEPVFIRKMQQEKLDETENRYGQRYENINR